MAHRDRVCRISPAGVQSSVIAFFPAPDNHLAAGPNCGVTDPSNRRVLVAGRYPTIGGGSVSPATVQIRIVVAASSPYDHFTASPNRTVTGTWSRCIRCTCGDPTVSAGIVSATGGKSTAG